MAHPRKLAREAIVARLIAANTEAGDRVASSRVEPNRKSDLPAIAVYTSSEDVDRDASAETAPRELKRTVRVEILIWVGSTEAYPFDDRMDDMAEEVEAAMDADRYLDGTAYDSILESTEMRPRAAEGNDPIAGLIVLTYAVTYHSSPAVGTLDDFLRAKATHKLVGGVTDTVPAIDQFTVQEPPP